MVAKTPIFFLLLICQLQRKANGFSTPPQRPLASHRHPLGFVSSRQSLSTSSTLFSTIDKIDEDKKKAVEALEKLLDKQRAEIRETEELLRHFHKSDTVNATFDSDSDTDNLSSLKASAIAKSMMAGFDYGFVSRSEGCTSDSLSAGSSYESEIFQDYGPPSNIVSLGNQQFWRNLNAMVGEYKDEEDVKLTPKQEKLRGKLKQLTLNSTAIWERETADGPIQAPLLIKIPYLVLCFFLDTVFEGRYVPSRFFLLETVARMPYFSYITMLHLYETLGFWRRSADVKRVHFAEEWNEFNHLLIMESLGGDQSWWVRFMAQHSAIAYFVALLALWSISPTLAYKFSELLETHAVNTYGQLLDENEELLKELPPSTAAVQYYSFGAADPFFGEYQTTALSKGEPIRQPGTEMRTLFDVFTAIRADEGDHVGTMKACLDPSIAVSSPSLERRLLTGVALAATFGYYSTTGDIENVGDIVDSVTPYVGAASPFVNEISNIMKENNMFEEERGLAGFDPDMFETDAIASILPLLKQGLLDALEFLGILGLLGL
uniref:Alternative oxidase n=1 Tax=Ditylum brightwellii TaxID=49249 RepID=A0A7S4RC77_9STRA|mmetsp:Transcript_36801/g.49270  ORF Transcript_36801/g.49270 Transcript_36801/m.49270 type:complete len:547 (-) Transcript_36801:100-1740(-)